MPGARQLRMTHHVLEPTIGVLHDYFSRDLAPALQIDSGDTVTVRSLDARGYLQEPAAPGAFGATLLPGGRGHALCGPIHVRSAEPGMAIAVRLVKLTTAVWGWTEAGSPTEAFTHCLTMPTDVKVAVHWQLDPQSLVGTNNLGFSVDLHPFLGVIGLAPADAGEHSTIPPRLCGGNIDCKDLVQGSVLYLPVAVEGALLSVGDGHARQGDGEVSGTAIECGMTTELEVTVIPDPVLTTPYATTPSGRITFGFDEDLTKASVAAMNAMLTWMEQLFTVSRAEALALASAVVDLRVTQVANGVWGVHAVLADDALRAS
ncbi:MAG: acetamidase [Frankiales bacterium]|nr:acetamidase [Frankiales bacterium]